MPYSKYADLISCGNDAVQGDVSGLAERDHKLPNLALDPASCEWVQRQHFDRAANCRTGRTCRGRIARGQEAEHALQIVERTRRIDYLRHAFGRGAFPSVARRSIQAWTSRAA